MKFKFSIIFLFFLGISCIASAQNTSNFNFNNIQNVNVDNLSQQQIQQIYQQAKARGLSVDQVAQLAVQRGMSPTQAQKLRSRLNEVQSSSSVNNQNNPLNTPINRMRHMPPPDTTNSQFFNQFFGVTSSRDSLLFNQSIQRIKYQTKQDSIALAQQKLKDKIFGFNLFTNKTTSFEPSLNIPTPKNYQLGAGDQIIIDIYGAAQHTYDLQVSPDGMVNINKLGPISVDGLTIDEAKKRLKKQLGRIYSGLNPKNQSKKDTYMQLTLGQLRSIKVSVIGEAAHPGTYTLPSLATVFNAIYSAGGPTVNGSFRDIDVIRGDSVIETFDLYNLLVNGDQSKNIRLRDQDIIKINPYISRVHVEGEVKRPGIYEMKKSGTLADLLRYAGGFKGDAYKKQVKVFGNTNRERSISDVSRKNFKNFKIQNGDSVKVQKVLNRFKNLVEIHGAVFRPGKFQLTDSTTVYSLIKQAGGLRGDAFTNRGIIYRKQKNYTLKTLQFNVHKVMENPKKHDIPLKKNDLVIINSIFNMRGKNYVKIKGPVQNPGRYKYAKGMTLQDLILQANGFTKEATPRRVEVARRISNRNGNMRPSQIAKIYHFNLKKNLTLGPKSANFVLKPYDIVYVRQAPNYEAQKQVEITGQVRYPGTYAIKSKNDRISDLIKRAGGLTNEAYPKGAALFRKLKRSQLQGNKFAEKVKGYFTRIDTTDSLTNAPKPQPPQKTTISKVGIQLSKIMKNPGSKYDLFVRKGDSIHVPKKLQTVFVKGGVYNPTSIRYDKQLNFQDYITEAGGYNEKAKKDKSYIIYANGNVNRVKKFLFFKNYPKVKPGATLVIPEKRKVTKLSPRERVAILSAVVSTAALISTTIIQIVRL